MFAKQIVDSDAFLDMPPSTQNLYFHLAMRADDEGFIDNPKKVMRVVSATQDDMNVLITKRFVLVFESGVIVIKHWKIHNYIRQDRLTPTVYTTERESLEVKENKSYTERQSDVRQLPDKRQTNVSIGKVRLGKDRLGKNKPSCSTSDEANEVDGLELEIELAEKMVEIIKKYDPRARVPTSFLNWAKSIDRMMRIDKRTPDEIISLFEWSQNDEFWNANIRSPDKLRKQWEKLWARRSYSNSKASSKKDELKNIFEGLEDDIE